MARLISIELLKIRKRTMTKVLLVILLAVMAMLPFLLYILLQQPVQGPEFQQQGAAMMKELADSLKFPGSFVFTFSILQNIGGILLIILAAGVVGSEYGWGTVRTMLANYPARYRYLGAKLVALAIVGVIGMLLGLVAGTLGSLGVTLLMGEGISADSITADLLGSVAMDFLRTSYTIMPYTALAFFLSVLGRSAMPGIAGGLAYTFLESMVAQLLTLLGGWAADIAKFSFDSNIKVLMALNGASGVRAGVGVGVTGDEVPALDPWQAALLLLAYSAVLAVAAFVIFRRRDVTA